MKSISLSISFNRFFSNFLKTNSDFSRNLCSMKDPKLARCQYNFIYKFKFHTKHTKTPHRLFCIYSLIIQFLFRRWKKHKFASTKIWNWNLFSIVDYTSRCILRIFLFHWQFTNRSLESQIRSPPCLIEHFLTIEEIPMWHYGITISTKGC